MYSPLNVENVLPDLITPSLRDGSLFAWIPGNKLPGYHHLVPPGQTHLRPYVDAYGQLPDPCPPVFEFQLGFALDLRSEYSIRLYQYLKRWEFAKRRSITVDQLRLEIGATEIDRKGNIVRINLEQYKHLKSRAINPAIEEINRETDLSVSYTETKFPRSKAVQSVTFPINQNPEHR